MTVVTTQTLSSKEEQFVFAYKVLSTRLRLFDQMSPQDLKNEMPEQLALIDCIRSALYLVDDFKIGVDLDIVRAVLKDIPLNPTEFRMTDPKTLERVEIAFDKDVAAEYTKICKLTSYILTQTISGEGMTKPVRDALMRFSETANTRTNAVVVYRA